MKIDTDAGKFNQSRYIFVSHCDWKKNQIQF
jgi:hypothetical protein